MNKEDEQQIIPANQDSNDPGEELTDNALTDYRTSRKTLQSLIDSGSIAIDRLAAIADQNEKDRSFEVLSQMIKNTSEVVEKLSDLHDKTIKTIAPSVEETKQNSTTNNVVFIGSTVDLQRELLKQTKVIDEPEDDEQ